MLVLGLGVVEGEECFVAAGGKRDYEVREMIFEIIVGGPDERAGEERSLT